MLKILFINLLLPTALISTPVIAASGIFVTTDNNPIKVEEKIILEEPKPFNKEQIDKNLSELKEKLEEGIKNSLEKLFNLFKDSVAPSPSSPASAPEPTPSAPTPAPSPSSPASAPEPTPSAPTPAPSSEPTPSAPTPTPESTPSLSEPTPSAPTPAPTPAASDKINTMSSEALKTKLNALINLKTSMLSTEITDKTKISDANTAWKTIQNKINSINDQDQLKKILIAITNKKSD